MFLSFILPWSHQCEIKATNWVCFIAFFDQIIQCAYGKGALEDRSEIMFCPPFSVATLLLTCALGVGLCHGSRLVPVELHEYYHNISLYLDLDVCIPCFPFLALDGCYLSDPVHLCL